MYNRNEPAFHTSLDFFWFEGVRIAGSSEVLSGYLYF